MRNNKLSLVGMQLPEKYKEKLDVSREGPAESSGVGVKEMLSRDRFYIRNIKAHVIFPTPATNFLPKPLRSKRRISLCIFHIVAFPGKLVIINTTYTGTDSSIREMTISHF
jgi:hypothetical protein